ncbi:hypothetical protein R1flu_027861 [Riccia fluitans]|uniref:LOB domain-containing protein n=1 Tax=Riccia fluitans TaxID=41844 RepID=A0ABD1XKQ6_9MARC
MPGSGMSPCAACKLLRRRCAKDCVFAPYFPPDEPQKFANVHKVFGASNVNKMLQDLPVEARGDAVSSMVYEADARVRDPVYGCVGAISSLQQQVAHLQTQLAVANAEIVCIRMHQSQSVPNQQQHQHQQQHMEDGNPLITSNSPPLTPSSPNLNQHMKSSVGGYESLEISEHLWSQN